MNEGRAPAQESGIKRQATDTVTTSPKKSKFGTEKTGEEKKAKGIKKANSSSIDVGEKGTATSLSPEEKDVVMTVFKSHFMLSKLTEEQRNQLLSVIHRQSTAAEEVLFRQGEAGDHLYIVKSGTFKVFIGEELRRTMDGKSVFGELALIYSQPRTATVVCDQPGELWRIHGGLVRQMLADVARARFMTGGGYCLLASANFG